MNEIICKIALEAKLGGAQFEEGVRYYVGTEDTFIKFAEMIIRECIDAVSEDEDDFEYVTRPQLINEIKDHFGLK